MLKIKNFNSFNRPQDLSIKISPNNNINVSADEINKNLNSLKNIV
jgi:hypothetical protein